jgi:hypothetical protein
MRSKSRRTSTLDRVGNRIHMACAVGSSVDLHNSIYHYDADIGKEPDLPNSVASGGL